MSVVSMTGFGRGEASDAGVKAIVEISSVNRRQFDCAISLPRELAPLESRVYALVQKSVRRGMVKGLVRISEAAAPPADRPAVRVNLPLARARVTALRDAARKLGLADDLGVNQLALWPDVMTAVAPSFDAMHRWPLVEAACRQSLLRMTRMRRREGAALARDLKVRFRVLNRLTAEIRRRAPQVQASYREALIKRLESIGMPFSAADPQLLREVVLFADRSDISEELTRIESHLTQAGAWLQSPEEACGRSLDFLCQELFREINTIGAKANDEVIARRVIAFKSALESAREQAQNVE